jgi:hypothetical protein
MRSVLTGVHVHWLAHLCLGLLIVMTEKGKTIQISHSDTRLLVTFSGVWYLTTGNTFSCLTMIQKRKNTKTRGNLINTRELRQPPSPRTNTQIASCFDALSITSTIYIMLSSYKYRKLKMKITIHMLKLN